MSGADVAGGYAGSIVGGLIGGAVGSFFGPLGTAAGRFVGSRLGNMAGRAAVGALESYMSSAEDAEDEAEKTDEAEGTKAEAEACATCRPPECKEIIQKLKEKIDKLGKERKKYRPKDDAIGGHSFMAGGVLRYTKPCGHYNEILDLQRGIKNSMKRYAESKCYDGAPAKDKITMRAGQYELNDPVEIPPGCGPTS